MYCGSQGSVFCGLIVGPNPPALSGKACMGKDSLGDRVWFGFGRFMGWQVGTALARIPDMGSIEAGDEGEEYCMTGTGTNAKIITSMGTYGEGGWPVGILTLNPALFTSIGTNTDIPGTRMSERKYQSGVLKAARPYR